MSALHSYKGAFITQPALLEEWKLIFVFCCLYVNHGLSIMLLTMSEHVFHASALFMPLFFFVNDFIDFHSPSEKNFRVVSFCLQV